MSSSPGEHTREFYRAQGENRLAEAIIKTLEELEQAKPNAAWSPRFLINQVKAIYETRNTSN
jgi:hypothetical protein